MSDLLKELWRRHVQVAADGNRLLVDAPAGALTPELRTEIAAHKDELLAELAAALFPDEPRAPCPTCGRMAWAWSAVRGRYICFHCEYNGGADQQTTTGAEHNGDPMA